MWLCVPHLVGLHLWPQPLDDVIQECYDDGQIDKNSTNAEDDPAHYITAVEVNRERTSPCRSSKATFAIIQIY